MHTQGVTGSFPAAVRAGRQAPPGNGFCPPFVRIVARGTAWQSPRQGRHASVPQRWCPARAPREGRHARVPQRFGCGSCAPKSACSIGVTMTARIDHALFRRAPAARQIVISRAGCGTRITYQRLHSPSRRSNAAAPGRNAVAGAGHGADDARCRRRPMPVDMSRWTGHHTGDKSGTSRHPEHRHIRSRNRFVRNAPLWSVRRVLGDPAHRAWKQLRGGRLAQ
jgi:hypothetical protein